MINSAKIEKSFYLRNNIYILLLPVLLCLISSLKLNAQIHIGEHSVFYISKDAEVYINDPLPQKKEKTVAKIYVHEGTKITGEINAEIVEIKKEVVSIEKTHTEERIKVVSKKKDEIKLTKNLHKHTKPTVKQKILPYTNHSYIGNFSKKPIAITNGHSHYLRGILSTNNIGYVFTALTIDLIVHNYNYNFLLESSPYYQASKRGPPVLS